jgi:GTP-binding protein HflX
VGDATKLVLPDIGRLRAAEGRFRGLRLVHTHLRGESLTRDDRVDLVRLRLDLVAAIGLSPTGELRSMSYAHNIPSETGDVAAREITSQPFAQVHLDVGRLMGDLEAEFARRARARAVRAKDGRAIVVHVGDKSKGAAAVREAEDSVRELRELARSAGTDVVDSVIQMRDRLDSKFVLGRGKLEEVVVRAIELDANVLIFDRDLTPAQASSIARHTDLHVVDRTQLILDIFAQRAESRDGKLQVELAQLKYAMPRLSQKDDSLSRLTGGIGGRGPGETKLEIGRRRANDRVTHLERELRQLAMRRRQRRRKRAREGVPTVAIVGYTNAGKSTLLNTLTGADVLAEDKLFATLDTRSRVLRCGWAGWGDREVVLTDTVGFIRRLPKDLFAAFRATFEEAADADLLLHAVDASDPCKGDHIRTVTELLEELDLADLPRLLVYTKVDLLENGDRRRLQRLEPHAVLVCATERESTRALLDRMACELASKWDRAARGPTIGPDVSLGLVDDDECAGIAQGVTTLDEMLRAAGKRVRERRDG